MSETAPAPTLQRLGPLSMVSLAARRGRGGALREATAASFGVELPGMGEWTEAGAVRFVATGPGQWLALRAEADPALFDQLEAALGHAVLLVDVSDTRAVWRVSGSGAREVLARLVPVDLHPRTMQPGCAIATVAAHVGVLLWQVDAAPTYDVAGLTSYAASFAHHLGEAS